MTQVAGAVVDEIELRRAALYCDLETANIEPLWRALSAIAPRRFAIRHLVQFSSAPRPVLVGTAAQCLAPPPTCHFDRSKPTPLLHLRSCEGVGLRSGEISLRSPAQPLTIAQYGIFNVGAWLQIIQFRSVTVYEALGRVAHPQVFGGWVL